MEDLLFHAILISDIIDHSKFMDKDFVYEAFMSWRGLVVVIVVVAAAVVFFSVFFSVRVSDRQCQAVVIRTDYQLTGYKNIKNKSFLPLISQLYSFYGQ